MSARLLLLIAALATPAIGACSRSASPATATTDAAATPATSVKAGTPAASRPAASSAAVALPVVLVHKSLTCGCCAAWVQHLRASGFTVNVDETGAMQLVQGTGEWLEMRARAERPESVHMSRAQQQQIGLDLLLRDLEVDEFGHGGRR